MRPPLAALALSGLLVTAGCLGFLQSGPSDPGAEVVEEAVAAGESVETYRVRTQLHAAGTANGDRRMVAMTSKGAVDRPARKLRIAATRGDRNRTVYVIGNATYTQCTSPWSGWGVEVQGELNDDWRGHDPLGRQLRLLAESPVTWIGNETLRGTPVHVVEAHPSDRTLTQFSEDRRPLIDVFGPRIENASLKAWIAEDSARVLRTHLAFDVHTDDASVETRMTTRFSDYGAGVEITRPDEATEDPFRFGCPGE